MRIVALTVLALVAFAANSILCRLALGPGLIDAVSFTFLRLASGALVLVILVSLSRGFGPRGRGGHWMAAAMLFLYAIGFSLAYRTLAVGTGALLLFGAVQATMLGAAFRSGERPSPAVWTGLAVALAGLVVLVAPGVRAPAPGGALLMVSAGVAWGVYSVLGRRTGDPLAATADNFVRSVPFVGLAAAAIPLIPGSFRMTASGAWLAILSGALTSGVGYVVWYAALQGLTATRAATVQLAVPVLAAGAGVLFLGEAVTLRLVGSAILILGGVATAFRARARVAASPAR